MIQNNNTKNTPAEVVELLDEYIELIHIKSPRIHALRDKYRRKAGMKPQDEVTCAAAKPPHS